MTHRLRLVTNRPGLSAIAYRIGTHGRFKRDLLERIAADPALRGLTTRSDDDFAIALLDAWSCAADALTFYQERLANESYLRTATERQSLAHLARLLGYELGPGVAAGAALVFTVDALGARGRPVALAAGTRVQSIPGPGEQPIVYETDEPLEARAEHNELRPARTGRAPADGLVTLGPVSQDIRILTRTRVAAGDVLLAAAAADPRIARLVAVDAVTPRPDLDGLELTLSRFSGPAPAGPERLAVFRRRAALFGHNAPDANVLDFADGALFDGAPPSREWKDFAVQDGPLDLDAVYPDLRVGDRLAVRDGDHVLLATVAAVDLASRAAFALNARLTRLTLADERGDPRAAFHRRSADVLLSPEPLVLLAPPRDDAVAGDLLELEGRLPDLAVGRALLVAGPRDGDGQPLAELAAIAHLERRGDTTAVRLAAPLQHRYRRDATLVRANVARASHGETVREVLGSGDATRPLQRFALRQGPLTFVPGAAGLGRASTLTIDVDGERWREVDSFEAAGPRDRVYTVALGEDGAALVQFGDGQRGARLPSGTGNVRATYRKGLGLAGHLDDGRLTLLTTPTLGVLGVTNPLPTAGAAPPEDLADARRNAPLPVRTLGRVVSLRDYEDFARAFTGVAKAHAARFRDGARPVVLVTIAGHGGAALPLAGATATALLAALRGAGDPFVIVRLHTYDPRGAPPPTFTLAGRITAAPARDLAALRAAVARALTDRFGFAAGEFARPIHRSEVVAAIQAVPGVVAVDLTGFARTGAPEPPTPHTRLVPRIAAGFAASDPPTELLTLDPAALSQLEVTR